MAYRRADQGSRTIAGVYFLACPLRRTSTQLVVAISSRALFDFEEENCALRPAPRRDVHRAPAVAPRAARQAGHRLSPRQEAPRFQCRRRQARGGRDPVAQRSGVGAARDALGGRQRAGDRARRVHARPRAVGVPAAAQRQPLPLGESRGRARSRSNEGFPAAVVFASTAIGRLASRRGAHRLRRRRRALRRRGRARLPRRRARRVPVARSRATRRGRCRRARSSRCSRRCIGCSRPTIATRCR